MSTSLTHAIRALRDHPRAPGDTPPPTAQVNPDAPVVCAGALAPPVRKRRDPAIDRGFDQEWTELSRETEVVRITASDGSGAWVDVERPIRLVLVDDRGRRLVLNFNSSS